MIKEGVFQEDELIVFVTRDAGLWHLSVSHHNRLPTYEELKRVRYKFMPNGVLVAQIFPPKEDFVNLHPNVLHLWELSKDVKYSEIVKEV